MKLGSAIGTSYGLIRTVGPGGKTSFGHYLNKYDYDYNHTVFFMHSLTFQTQVPQSFKLEYCGEQRQSRIETKRSMPPVFSLEIWQLAKNIERYVNLDRVRTVMANHASAILEAVESIELICILVA